MKTHRLSPALPVFSCFLLVCAGLFAQEELKTGKEHKPREQNLLIYIPLTLAYDK